MPATIVGHRGYATIRDFWEHYTEFADIYDRFALSSDAAVEQLERLFGFDEATVLNLSAGTGRDSFAMARTARRVVGVEPSAVMREYALTRQAQLGIDNVEFVDGVGENLSRFGDGGFDRAISIHGAPFEWDTEAAMVRECLRIVRPGGYVAIVSTTPGSHLDHELGPPAAVSPDSDFLENHLGPFGFLPVDVAVEIDYGSVAEALNTWGCVYGEAAINYLLERQTSVLGWKLRIWYRRV